MPRLYFRLPVKALGYVPCDVGISSCAPCMPWTSWPEARISCGMGDGIAGGSMLLLATGLGEPMPGTKVTCH